MQSAFFVLPNQYISPPPVCQQRFFSFLNIFQIRRQEYSLNSLEGAFKPASRRSGQAISRRPSEAKGGVLNGEPEQPERARAESAEQPEGAAPEPEGKPQVSSSFLRQRAGYGPALCFYISSSFGSPSGGRPTSGISSRLTIWSISSSRPHSSLVKRVLTRSMTASI